MFTYLLIAAELAIVYFAFYYLYVWEPSEYKVSKDIWGLYEDNPPSAKPDTSVTLVFSNKLRRGFNVVDSSKLNTRDDGPEPPATKAA